MKKIDYRLRTVKDNSPWPKRQYNSRAAFARFYEMTEKKRLAVEITGLLSKIIQQKSE